MRNPNYKRAVHPWQRACIDRGANCKGCDNAIASLGYTCKIKDTEQVAHALHRNAAQSRGSGQRPPREVTCERCEKVFVTAGPANTKICPACRPDAKREYNRDYQVLRNVG